MMETFVASAMNATQVQFLPSSGKKYRGPDVRLGDSHSEGPRQDGGHVDALWAEFGSLCAPKAHHVGELAVPPGFAPGFGGAGPRRV